MLCLINTSDTLWIWVPRVFPCTRTSSIKHKLHKYRICSIRCHGYYLFDRAILCGFYSRAATNRERRLFSSVFSVKSFVIVRALRKASFIRLTKNCDAVTWFWSKHFSLINRRFATKQYLHGTSNPFPCFLPMISQDDRSPSMSQKLLNFSGQREFLYLSHILLPFETRSCSHAHVLLEY